MSTKRLIDGLTKFDAAEMDKVFGGEHILQLSKTSINLAPVNRVAIIAEAFLPKVDGVSKSVYLTLRYLQQTGREVMVFAPDLSIANVGPSRVIALPALGMPFAPETRMALPSLAVGRYLDSFKPDLIHMFSPAAMSVSGVLAGRRRHIPVIGNYQTDLPGYATKHYKLGVVGTMLRWWLRYVHNRCHLTLAPSMYTLRELRRDGYRRLRVWGRGVNGERFSPAHRTPERRAKLLAGRDPNSLLCLYVGRLAPEKRVDLLIDVARLPGVAITVVGDGAAREELERMFEGTDTHFTGYLYGEDLAHAYANSDVFLFGGQSETFGQVVQEAMSSGLPAVIINEGGITDLVEDGHNGFICPPDPHAFAAAVWKLKENPELRDQMSRNSRHITEQRPWEVIMAQLENYYEEAVELNRRFNRIYHLSTVSRRTLPTLVRLNRHF